MWRRCWTKSSGDQRGDFITVRPCGRELFELIPRRVLAIDINSAASRLQEAGFQIIERSELVLQIKKEKDISIYPNGKMLVFPAENGEAAETIGRDIMNIIRNCKR